MEIANHKKYKGHRFHIKIVLAIVILVLLDIIYVVFELSNSNSTPSSKISLGIENENNPNIPTPTAKFSTNISIPNNNKKITRVEDKNCALLFFGIPRCFYRSYESIQKYIVNTNPSCHIYLHTYNISILPGNERNNESDVKVNISEVYLITENVTMTNMDDFYKTRNLSYYRTYFPTSERTTWVYPTSMDNMIKQWHSIDSVWNYMESATNDFHKDQPYYKRIGLFRTDLIYRTPIYVLENNNDAVQPCFGLTNKDRHYMNDRFFYGTYNSCKVWASNRFGHVPTYISTVVLNETGKFRKRGLHSETFLFDLMKDIPVTKAPVCASRVRNNCAENEPNDCNYFFKNHMLLNITNDHETLEIFVKIKKGMRKEKYNLVRC